MNTSIDIIQKVFVKNSEGFSTDTDIIIASVRAYREKRHGTKKWANRASFSVATDLFRFRCIPGITVTTSMIIQIKDERFEITSVEDVKNRRMYVEVLAKEVKPSG